MIVSIYILVEVIVKILQLARLTDGGNDNGSMLIPAELFGLLRFQDFPHNTSSMDSLAHSIWQVVL